MMRLILAFAIIILVICPKPFWATNPFAPPANIQLFYQVIYPDPSVPAIDYKMYMQTGNKMIALLNGTFVSEGDMFETMKVISVNSRRVILSDSSGEKHVVVIDAMQSSLQKLREIMNEENQ